jgi:CheY-like chemotaxis protein
MKTILLLEDSECVIDLMRRVMSLRGYKLLEAVSGEDAVRVCKQHGPIDLLIADQYLPGGMTGVDLAVWIRQQYGNIPVLFISGTSIPYWTEAANAEFRSIPASSVGFVQKPFAPKEILAEMDRLMNTRVRTAGGC